MQEQAWNNCKNLSEEEKDKRKERQYRRNKYKNMSEEDKQKLKEYGKRYNNAF